MKQQIIYPAIKIHANEKDKRPLRAAYFVANSVPPILPSTNSHISEDLRIWLTVLPTNALVSETVTIKIKRAEKNKNISGRRIKRVPPTKDHETHNNFWGYVQSTEPR